MSRIEAVLGPRGALITCPDRIRGLITGRLREVDASLRYADGRLVVLECRMRGRAQDVTWIEQLAGRRHDVGASLAVAVSSEGFSEAAKRSADYHGILLRRMADVTDDELAAEWVRCWNFAVEQIRIRKPQTLYVVCEKADGETSPQGFVELEPELVEGLMKDLNTPFVFTRDKNEPVALSKLLANLKIEDLPDDGSYVERKVRVDCQPGRYYTKTVRGERNLVAFQLTASFAVRRAPMDGVRYHEYTQPNGGRAELMTGTFHLLDRDEQFNVVLIPPDKT